MYAATNGSTLPSPCQKNYLSEFFLLHFPKRFDFVKEKMGQFSSCIRSKTDVKHQMGKNISKWCILPPTNGLTRDMVELQSSLSKR